MCSNNLKNIGTIATTYAIDFDATIPPYNADIWYSARYDNPAPDGSGRGYKSYLDTMWGKMTPYNLTKEIAQCPLSGYTGKNAYKYWMQTYNSRSSYFYTMTDYTTWGGYWDPRTYKLLMLTSGTISGTFGNPMTAAQKEIVKDTCTDFTDLTASYANNHRKKSGYLESQNILFLDGHIELRRPPRTSKGLGLGADAGFYLLWSPPSTPVHE
ncbi:MAG TPA: hypothetical protein DCZ94_17145 [Lentisphaeria bacterium]|nr:MAG: hypothetical protein A2X48_21035 [Lentisphaerae bacterium GWF2_49_21]HBC88672.1 hypothetical protein [Lentisphaeria bacterium]